MDQLGRAASRFGQDRAAGCSVCALGPNGSQPNRLAVLSAQKVWLLLAIHLQPLVPPISRHQAAVASKRSLEEVGGSHLLDSGIDRLRSTLLGPVGLIAPPHLTEH